MLQLCFLNHHCSRRPAACLSTALLVLLCLPAHHGPATGRDWSCGTIATDRVGWQKLYQLWSKKIRPKSGKGKVTLCETSNATWCGELFMTRTQWGSSPRMGVVLLGKCAARGQFLRVKFGDRWANKQSWTMLKWTSANFCPLTFGTSLERANCLGNPNGSTWRLPNWIAFCCINITSSTLFSWYFIMTLTSALLWMKRSQVASNFEVWM